MNPQIGRILSYVAGVVAIVTAAYRAVTGDYDGAGMALALGLTALGLDTVLTGFVAKLREVLPSFIDLDVIVAKLLELLQRQEARMGGAMAVAAIPRTGGTTVVSPHDGVVSLHEDCLCVCPDGGRHEHDHAHALVRIQLTDAVHVCVTDGQTVRKGDALVCF